MRTINEKDLTFEQLEELGRRWYEEGYCANCDRVFTLGACQNCDSYNNITFLKFNYKILKGINKIHEDSIKRLIVENKRLKEEIQDDNETIRYEQQRNAGLVEELIEIDEKLKCIYFHNKDILNELHKRGMDYNSIWDKAIAIQDILGEIGKYQKGKE
jgi:hypothetical protein